MSLDLSIIIVNWNTKQLLDNCLASIYKKISGYSSEIIVVDNGSRDGSNLMVAIRYPQVKLIKNRSNQGFAKANNQGIAIAQGRYILLLNSDTEVIGNSIEGMIKMMDLNRHLGACTPQILNSDLSIQSQGRKLPHIYEVFLKLFFPNQVYRALMKKSSRATRLTKDGFFEIDCLTGAVCMVRREVIEKVGMLDISLPIYAEDIDWCYRIRKAGWKIACFTNLRIIHIGERTSRHIPVATEVASRKALLAYFIKNHGKVQALIVEVMIRLSSLLRYIAWSLIFSIFRGNKAALRRRAYSILLTTRLNTPAELL